MENRSRFTALASTAVGVVGISALRRARRRASARAAANDTTASLAGAPPPSPPVDDEAHAPGHRHLPLTAEVRDERPPKPVQERPFAKHRHGLRQPGRG